MNRRVLPLPSLSLLVLAALVGGMVAARPLVAGRFDPYHKLAIFTKVLSYIENNYVEDIPESELMYGAARGLTEVLDPHSRFMDPGEYEKLKRETEGNAEIIGIGIDLEKRKRGFVVVSPIEGSPAWRAGIESGDLIDRIDGIPAGPLDWNDAISRIQGPAGSEVVLSILRRGRSLVFHIKREKFEVKAVEWRMLADGYGYIRGPRGHPEADAEDGGHPRRHPRRPPQSRRSARPRRQDRGPVPDRRAHRAYRG
jgi:carboxyl-terminal processing protease